MKRHESWLKQAQDEYRWAQVSLDARFYAQTCFVAQQVAEKALKSIAFYRKAVAIKSHSLANICKELAINGQLEKYSKVLDLYYISTRYPDALPDYAVPAESFSKEQAEEAIKMAFQFIEAARTELGL